MDLNHSDRSEFQDRELIEAVLQKSEDVRLNESGGSRLSSIALQIPSLRSTGNLSRPASVVSRRSYSLSQERLSDICDADTLEKDKISPNYEEIKLNLLILLLLCVTSLVLALLSMQVVVSLPASMQQTNSRTQASETYESLVEANRTFMTVTEVTTALSMFVVVCDVTCLLVCSLQSLIIVRIMKLNLGDERALKYLKECSSSRLIAISGFFVSVPVFLVSLILYVVLKFTTTAAVTAMLILTVGCVFCLLSLVQNTYHWRIERSRAAKGLPVFECGILRKDEGTAKGKELSTLV